MRDFEGVWGFILDNRKHRREPKHILRFKGVRTTGLQARAKKKVRNSEFSAFVSCASLRKLGAALRLKCRGITNYASDMVHKAPVRENNP